MKKLLFQINIKIFILLYIFNIIPIFSQERPLIRFSGGSSHDTYQPSIIIPILTETFNRMDMDVSFDAFPSLRSLTLSNSGEYDGELHRVFDFYELSEGKYPNLLRVDTEIMSVYLSYFSAIKGLEINSVSDLAGYKIAYYRGRKNVDKLLVGYVPLTNIFLANNDEIAFKMLSMGRVDIVISEEINGQRLIKKYKEFSSIYRVKNIEETKIYTYLHKKHFNLLPIINETLNQMKEDGSYQKIFMEARSEFLN